MKNIDSKNHTRGESIYVDDLPLIQGTLFAAIFDSKIAHGRIKNLDLTRALALSGVERVLTCKDIPGENQIGGIVPDEPLLADEEVHFCGMPIAVVLAKSQEIANHALKLIEVEIEAHRPIVDPREAASLGKLIIPPRTFQIGDVDSEWENCAHIFEGKADSNGQEHLYIETQGCYSIPQEGGKVKVISSTQGPTAVQRCVAKVLGVGMHMVEIDVTRLGGGFGGKEDQANTWAAIAALGSFCTGRPVKCILDRMADMRMTGKRHPYSTDFKIGFDKDLKIKAYKATFYQNAGAAADLSPAVLERTLFHATNAYHIPNVWARAYSCKTNLPPNTAFRGFGGPQGMFVIESALAMAAESLGIPKEEIQKSNLLKNGDELPYGQMVEDCEALNSWDSADRNF
jgi:xanthine dehydrogenase large subunit